MLISPLGPEDSLSNGLIDTSFDPPLLSLDSTFNRGFVLFEEKIFVACQLSQGSKLERTIFEGEEESNHTTVETQSRQSAKLFLQLSELELPHPSPAGECALPPFAWGGGAHSLAREGGGRVPIPTRGHTLWYSVYICTLWLESLVPL